MAAICALSVGLSLFILGARNLYEDEWTSIAVIKKPFEELVRWSTTIDIHPPGAYALDRLAFLVLGSARLVGAFHLLVWSAGTFVILASARHLLVGHWARAWCVAIALMHPHVLMWNTSLRWPPLWWGPALAIIALALLPRRRLGLPGWPMILGLGAATGLLVHLDYIALLFGPCLAVSWLVRHGLSSKSLASLSALAAVAAIIASPLLVPISTIIARDGPAQMEPPLRAALRMGYVLSVGDALLPWNPVSLVVLLGLFIPCTWLALRRVFVTPEAQRGDPLIAREWRALSAFAVLMACGIMSGMGSRSYTSIGLTPIAALALMHAAEQGVSRHWRLFASALIAMWLAAGAYNLLTRSGTAKRQFNDRPEDIIAELELLACFGPAVVVTDDAVMTFEINKRRMQGLTELVTCSCIADDVHGYPAGTQVDIASFPRVIILEHPDGFWDETGEQARFAIDAALELVANPTNVNLGHDPDWEWKNRLAGAGLRGSRLRATCGAPIPGDWAAVNEQMIVAASRSILGLGRAGAGE